MVLLLEGESVGLEGQFFKPNPAVLLSKTLIFSRIREEIVKKGRRAFERMGGVGFCRSEWILNILGMILLQDFRKAVLLLLEGHEVSDYFGLLRDEVQLIGL